LNKGIVHRKELGSDQIVDVSYSEFIKNPVNIIKNTYSTFGLDINIETENKMKAYLYKQKEIKKGKHTYSLEEFGLNEKIVNDHFQNYMMNFEF
jgi:hypothetical protein